MRMHRRVNVRDAVSLCCPVVVVMIMSPYKGRVWDIDCLVHFDYRRRCMFDAVQDAPLT